ncbi:MAG: hypothetical protein KGL39_14615 [Patescibacteria group bacterium]|nr:hypothetical protein [Patescibacteria group bacterium]
MSNEVPLDLSLRGTALKHAIDLAIVRDAPQKSAEAVVEAATAFYQFLSGPIPATGPSSGTVSPESETADKPKRGRKPASATAGSAPVAHSAAPAPTSVPPQPVAAPVAPPSPAPSPAPADAMPTLARGATAADAASALTRLAQSKGRQAAVDVLGSFGAATLALVPPDKLAAFVAACNTAMAQPAPTTAAASDLLA